ncbi:hypothetical protein SUGI_0492490 [Cryptomeria japonica]|nr:hypothetical protein SUGI_0492490 [Cryptomeria japonica]
MGRMMFRFKSLSRIVVHKHSAASISKTPCRKGQHLFTAGSPMVAFTSPPSTSTQAPNFNAFSGQFPLLGELAGGGGDEVLSGEGGEGGGDEVVGGGGREEYEVFGIGGKRVFVLGGGGAGHLASTAGAMMLAKQTITITNNTAPFLIIYVS